MFKVASIFIVKFLNELDLITVLKLFYAFYYLQAITL